MNYYNEFDRKKAAWLRQLISDGCIPKGHVDERSIIEVKPGDLAGYGQCHFFAGIGGWSYALQLAGWSEETPVWTGSCPCQPFSIAGKAAGLLDERHLWPAFQRLIAQCAPPVVFGEQVASKDGRLWLAGVRTDLEGMGYAVGAADLCAAGVSSPHPRQRLYWVADSDSYGASLSSQTQPGKDRTQNRVPRKNGASSAGLVNADSERRKEQRGAVAATAPLSSPECNGSHSRLVNADGYHEHWWSGSLQVGRNCIEGEIERGGRKYRAQWRVKPGLSLLADGIPGRVAQISGFGDAIVPQAAAEFIQAFQEI